MVKKGVLLMAYGSPEKEEDVEAYFTHIRAGRKPTGGELQNLKERYDAIGGNSPLFQITTSTAKKLQARLQTSGEQIHVYAGMKHWHPFIHETFEQLSRDRVSELVALALAPHYSKMSIGSYHDSVRKANEERGNKIKVKFVDDWYRNQQFLSSWKERILKAEAKKFRAKRDQIFFLFTAHSLPERILSWKDPYRDQLTETMELLASGLQLAPTQFDFTFQSAGHTSEPWLGPDILDKLAVLKGKGWTEVLVAPVGFVSDHLEILFDLDIEAKQAAEKLGMHLERTDSFNYEDDFINVLASVVQPLISANEHNL